MIIKQKKTKKRNPNKIQSFEGQGFFDNLLSPMFTPLLSAVTSKAAKEVAINLSKTAATKLDEKAIEKVTDKIFAASTPKKEEPPTKDEFTPQTRMLLNNIVARGSGFPGGKASSIKRI